MQTFRGKTDCCQPIEVVSYKIGVCKVSEKGRNCRTEFERISTNGNSSVVLCRPIEGRMHQIRVHLQYLGFPIINDPLYNHSVFGQQKGRGGQIGKSDDELIEDLLKIHNAESWLGVEGDSDGALLNEKSSNHELEHTIPERKSTGVSDFDPENPMQSIENNPLTPKNCSITRPPDITSPSCSPTILRPPLESAEAASQNVRIKNLSYKHIKLKSSFLG